MTNVQNLLRKKIQKNNFFFFYNYMRNFNKIPPHILVYANPFYLPIFQNQLNPLSSGGEHYKWQIPKQWLCIHIHKVDLSDILFLNWGKQWQQLIKTLPFCRSLNNFLWNLWIKTFLLFPSSIAENPLPESAVIVL